MSVGPLTLTGVRMTGTRSLNRKHWVHLSGSHQFKVAFTPARFGLDLTKKVLSVTFRPGVITSSPRNQVVPVCLQRNHDAVRLVRESDRWFKPALKSFYTKKASVATGIMGDIDLVSILESLVVTSSDRRGNVSRHYLLPVFYFAPPHSVFVQLLNDLCTHVALLSNPGTLARIALWKGTPPNPLQDFPGVNMPFMSIDWWAQFKTEQLQCAQREQHCHTAGLTCKSSNLRVSEWGGPVSSEWFTVGHLISSFVIFLLSYFCPFSLHL